jgi:hypothetical protein
MTHLYKHRLSLCFEGLENVLIQNPLSGAFCHGDALGSWETCWFSRFFNAWRHDLNRDSIPDHRSRWGLLRRAGSLHRRYPRRQPNAQ